jgi:hypothetical protein
MKSKAFLRQPSEKTLGLKLEKLKLMLFKDPREPCIMQLACPSYACRVWQVVIISGLQSSGNRVPTLFAKKMSGHFQNCFLAWLNTVT